MSPCRVGTADRRIVVSGSDRRWPRGGGCRLSRSERFCSCNDARVDIRQLGRLLADAHPDPYLRGGGMVAFHRRVEQAVAAVPEAGLTVAELLRLLRPAASPSRRWRSG